MQRIVKFITAVVTAMVLVRVFLVVAPYPGWFDSGEFIAAASGLGITHNPGYPVYSIAGHLIILLLPFSNVYFRLNLLSLICSAASGLLFGRTAGIWLNRRPGSVFWPTIVWFLGMGLTPLLIEQAVTNEVYSLDLLMLSLCLWAASRAGRYPEIRNLLLYTFLAGLAIANHLSALLWLPGTMILLPWKTIVKSVRTVTMTAAVFMILHAGIYLYLPLRADRSPVINWGNPARWTEFRRMVFAEAHRSAAIRSMDLADRLDRWTAFLVHLGEQYHWAVWALLATGLIFLALSHRRILAAAGVIALGHAVYAVYLNSVPFEATPFGIPLLAVLLLAAATGLLRSSGTGSRAWIPALIFVMPLLFTGTLPGRWCNFSKRFDLKPRATMSLSGSRPRYLAKTILDGCDPGSVVVAYSDSVVFPLIGMQAVERYRPDVTVLPNTYPRLYLSGLPPGPLRQPVTDCLAGVSQVDDPRFVGCLSSHSEFHGSIYWEMSPHGLDAARFFQPAGMLWRFDPAAASDPWPSDHGSSIFFNKYLGLIWSIHDGVSRYDAVSRSVAATALNTYGLYLQGWHPRLSAADAFFASAVQLMPDCAEAWVNIGLSQYANDDMNGAQNAMKRALEADPKLPAAHRNLGILAEKRGDYETAERFLRSAIRLDPEDPDLPQLLNRVIVLRKRSGEPRP